MTIVTFSRQIASLGDEIANATASKLGWPLLTRPQILEKFLKPSADAHAYQMLQESTKFYHKESKDGKTYLDHLIQELFDFVSEQSVVLVGFGSQVLFTDESDALHVRVVAPQAVRQERIKKQYRVDDEEAKRILTTADRKHKRFVSNVFGLDLTDPDLYDLTLNTAKQSVDACVAAILGLKQKNDQESAMQREEQDTPVMVRSAERPDFRHPAEIEFARILDMYQIDWVYEPKTFPIEWDAEGNVTLAFSPDFYLPQFDTYLELTTMNQKYVTLKNRKARKVRELYPGTNVKIVYKKDFQSLVERFSGQGGS